MANLIILWTGWDTIWKLGVSILIGYAILVANRVFHLNEHKPTLDWKAASWLIPYLIGMGLIVMTATIYRQTQFVLNDALRVNTDQVVRIFASCNSAFEQEARRLGGVKAVACAGWATR